MKQFEKILNICGKAVFFIIAAVVLFLITRSIETTPLSDKFNFKKENISYIEFADERLDCGRGEICLIEYIVHSNGLVFAKQEEKKQEGSENEADIRIGTIGKSIAGDLIAQSKLFLKSSGKSTEDCDNCRLFHLFYGGTEETQAFTARAENSPVFLAEISGKISKAGESLVPVDPFFLHFVFKPISGNAVDYHFYSDGIVLLEEFGERNGELLLSAVYSLSDEEIKKLKAMVADGYFLSAGSSFENCPEKGFAWGYLEASKGGKYKTVYTCGAGDSAADKLFNDLLEKTNENN